MLITGEPTPEESFDPAGAGDADAHRRFLSLFNAYRDRLFAYIMILTQNRADAEEVLQETALVVWREFHRYRPELDFKAWVRKIALNEVRRFRRKKPRALAFTPDMLDALAEQAHRLSGELERQRQNLRDCLRRLPRSDRDLLVLYYQPDQRAQGLARSRGVTVHAIYKAVKRIRRTLLECIRRERAEDAP